jgi:hypothetical protein
MIMDEDALAEMVKVAMTKATAHHDELRVMCVPVGKEVMNCEIHV